MHLLGAVAEQHFAAGNAAGLGQETHDGEAGHRLAGTGLADHGKGLAALEIEGHAVDGLGRGALADEPGLEVTDREDGVSGERARHDFHPQPGHLCPGSPAAIGWWRWAVTASAPRMA
ncbi:hypothetical protein FQZ97_1082600 [compost metagenome]